MEEISYYQGFLDSTSATEFVNSNFSQYSFVESIYFFDLGVGSFPIEDGLTVESFSAEAKDVYEFRRQGQKRFRMKKIPKDTELFTKLNNRMLSYIMKITSYLQKAAHKVSINPQDKVKKFY